MTQQHEGARVSLRRADEAGDRQKRDDGLLGAVSRVQIEEIWQARRESTPKPANQEDSCALITNPDKTESIVPNTAVQEQDKAGTCGNFPSSTRNTRRVGERREEETGESGMLSPTSTQGNSLLIRDWEMQLFGSSPTTAATGMTAKQTKWGGSKRQAGETSTRSGVKEEGGLKRGRREKEDSSCIWEAAELARGLEGASEDSSSNTFIHSVSAAHSPNR